MSNAVIVENVTKKFGKPGDPFWRQVFQRKKSTNGNGSNGHSGLNGVNNHEKLVTAVDQVSFEIEQGEIFGVLGPNGGGKSTLIRLLSTLLLPDNGQISVFGYDVERQFVQVQELINRVSVEASFFKKLSPMENLLYGARLYGLKGSETRRQVVEILTRLGLEKQQITSPMEEMSRGTQQKVAIARALLSHPRFLLLDEPTTNLAGLADGGCLDPAGAVGVPSGGTLRQTEREAAPEWIKTKGKMTRPTICEKQMQAGRFYTRRGFVYLEISANGI